MIKYKVIFDTNTIRNDKLNNFFGSQERLKELSNYADLIIPDLVFDEILNQKRNSFFDNKKKLTNNHVFQISELEENKIINIDNKVSELKNGIEFPFKKITVYNKDYCLDFIKNKALDDESPFGGQYDSGFKDCYIIYTIKEYIENFSENEVVFIICSGDKKLINAASKLSKNILFADKIDDIKSLTIKQYEDDYFLGKLRNELEDQEITKDNIKGLYFNTEYNDILEISLKDGENYLIHVSEREILSTILKKYVEKAIQRLQESPSFYETHNRLYQIKDLYYYLGKKHIEEIFQAILNNDQISFIINDEDVKQFLLDIRDFSKKNIDDDLFEMVFSLFNSEKLK